MYWSRLGQAAVCRLFLSLIVVLCMSRSAVAADASLAGTVVDQLGGRVAGATITLVREGQRVAGTTSSPRGEFLFEGVAEGRYQVDVRAAGFEPRTSDVVFLGATGRGTLQVALTIGALAQHVVITAAAGGVTQSQVGASVTVLDAVLLDALGSTDLLEPLRTIPGVEVVHRCDVLQRLDALSPLGRIDSVYQRGRQRDAGVLY